MRLFSCGGRCFEPTLEHSLKDIIHKLMTMPIHVSPNPPQSYSNQSFASSNSASSSPGLNNKDSSSSLASTQSQSPAFYIKWAILLSAEGQLMLAAQNHDHDPKKPKPAPTDTSERLSDPHSDSHNHSPSQSPSHSRNNTMTPSVVPYIPVQAGSSPQSPHYRSLSSPNSSSDLSPTTVIHNSFSQIPQSSPSPSANSPPNPFSSNFTSATSIPTSVTPNASNIRQLHHPSSSLHSLPFDSSSSSSNPNSSDSSHSVHTHSDHTTTNITERDIDTDALLAPIASLKKSAMLFGAA
jgi:hypothetical protein